MKRRLFIAIELPEAIRKLIEIRLENIKKSFKNDIRFSVPENWHLTLIFLGYQDEVVIPTLRRALKELSSDYGKLLVAFNKIGYGPPGRTPRMIWLTTTEKTSKELGNLQKRLAKNLRNQNIVWPYENREFRGHITLARFKPRAVSSLPPVEQNFVESFKVGGLNLMESHLSRRGAKYETLFTV